MWRWLAGIVLLGACGSPERDRAGGDTGGAVPVTFPTQIPREPESPQPPPSQWIRYELDATLRLNEIQLKGSHNSYHLRPLGNDDPQWLYDLPPLADQLETFGVRAVELDIHYVGGEVRVYHFAGVDPRTTCDPLEHCLRILRAWSAANPGHQPLFVFIEPRDQDDPEKFLDHVDDLERRFIDGWPRDKVFTPDDMTGSDHDVQTAMRKRGWPVLGALRGKVVFVLYAFGDLPYKYAHDGNGLWGRRMFVTAPDTAWRHAAILAMDSPLEQGEQIKAAVAEGFLVRTRSDDLPGRGRDFWNKRDAAFRSGAHIVLTDYPDPAYIPGYSSDLPGGAPSRCNPVTAPPACASRFVENPQLLAYPEGVEVVTSVTSSE